MASTLEVRGSWAVPAFPGAHQMRETRGLVDYPFSRQNPSGLFASAAFHCRQATENTHRAGAIA